MMKYAGIIILILGSTGTGFLLSEKLRQKILICGDLIRLCDMLLLDFEYRITPAKELLENALNSENIRHLGFISNDNISSKKRIKSTLSDAENEELSKFLFSLGKTDVNTQKMMVLSFREYIKNSMNSYREKYKRDSKIYVSFGFLFSAMFSLIWS